jgi:isoleucyl-tRNA synthetase
MDRWIYSELQELIIEVDQALANFDSQLAGKALATFIDDLSNWYVRRSRRRFWDGDPSALATLHECMHTLTMLLSPMVPFITEHVWQELLRPVDSSLAESVHLADFPVASLVDIDATLSAQVAQTRRIVELGRAARAESSVKIRQPLGRALIAAAGWNQLPDSMKDQIAEELNVIHLEDIAAAHGDLVEVRVKANFRTLGSKYGAAVQEIAGALMALPAEELVKEVRLTGFKTVATANGQWKIESEDLVITEQPKSGWTVANHDGESVALDLTLTPELIAAGQVREVIRFLQETRKNQGFEISDRIHVTYNVNADVLTAISAAKVHIQNEVLALEMSLDTSMALGENDLGLSASLEKAI